MPKQRNMASVFLTCGDKILLLFRKGSKVANNLWIASAGGHFEPEEVNDAKACALREMREELGLEESALSWLKLRYITLRRTAGEIRINYFFFAELLGGTQLPLQSPEGTLQWFDLEETGNLPQTFSGGAVLEHYRKGGRYDENLYVCVADGNTPRIVRMGEG